MITGNVRNFRRLVKFLEEIDERGERILYRAAAIAGLLLGWIWCFFEMPIPWWQGALTLLIPSLLLILLLDRT
jgi:hypothetical protein